MFRSTYTAIDVRSYLRRLIRTSRHHEQAIWHDLGFCHEDSDLRRRSGRVTYWHIDHIQIQSNARHSVSLWQRLKPTIKLLLAEASLVLPNALIVGLIMHQVAIYYFDAGNLDLIVTNSTLFLSLVAAQACLVSLYSFLWGIFVYQRIHSWMVSEQAQGRSDN